MYLDDKLRQLSCKLFSVVARLETWPLKGYLRYSLTFDDQIFCRAGLFLQSLRLDHTWELVY